MGSCEHNPQEAARLRCERCGHSTVISMAATEASRIIECVQCGASIFWHQCENCGLGYVGDAQACCPVCDAEGLEDLQIV